MANELVKQAKAAGGLMAMATLLANVEQSTEQLVQETGATSGSFLQYSGKTGEYKLNGKTIEPGTEFAFNFPYMKKGVICWRDSKPIKRETVLALGGEATPEAPPKAEQHPDDQWNFLVDIPIRCLDDGLEASFSLSTVTGTRALTNLFKEWGQKMRMHPEPDNPSMPQTCLVAVSSKRISFKDKKDPKTTIFTWVPEFKIMEWVPAAELNFAPVPEGDPAEDEVLPPEEVISTIEDAEIIDTTPTPEVPKNVVKAAVTDAPAAPTTRPRVGFGAGTRGRRV